MDGRTNIRTAQAGAVLSPLFTWRGAVASAESGLDPTQRLIALTLSLHMSERGDSCFPGVATLGGETGLCERAVQYGLRELEAQGWLVVKLGGGRGHTNRYTATIPERVHVVPRSWTKRVHQPTLKGAPHAPEVVSRSYKHSATSTTADNSHLDYLHAGAISDAERLRIAGEMRALVQRL